MGIGGKDKRSLTIKVEDPQIPRQYSDVTKSFLDKESIILKNVILEIEATESLGALALAFGPKVTLQLKLGDDRYFKGFYAGWGLDAPALILKEIIFDFNDMESLKEIRRIEQYIRTFNEQKKEMVSKAASIKKGIPTFKTK